MSTFEVWLCRDDGTRLTLLDTTAGFDYAVALHDVGACSLVLPGSFDRSLLAPDRRLEFWRAPAGGALALERVYLIRHLTDSTDREGRRTITVIGLDGNHLLKRRNVAYNEWSAQAEQTDQADDMARAVVIDNLGADAVAARQISTTYLSVAAERSAGPSLTMSFPRRDVLTVLQDIAKAADSAGTAVYWHMHDATPTAWQFRTYTGQPGADHTYPDGQNPVLLSLELGNLAEPTLDEDWSEEITYAYAGGAGEGEDRLIQTAEDTARSGRSLFGRCEGWADAGSEETDEGVLAAAQRLLAEGKPRVTLAASIVDSAGTRYGLHWRWGDRVTMVYAGRTMDAIVRAVRVRVDGNGKETIEARLESVE